MNDETVLIKQATKQGFIECRGGGGDRRGRRVGRSGRIDVQTLGRAQGFRHVDSRARRIPRPFRRIDPRHAVCLRLFCYLYALKPELLS